MTATYHDTDTMRRAQPYGWALMEHLWNVTPDDDDEPDIDRGVRHLDLGRDSDGDRYRLTLADGRAMYLETYVPDAPGNECMIASWRAQEKPLAGGGMANAIHDVVEELTRRSEVVRRLRRKYPPRTEQRE